MGIMATLFMAAGALSMQIQIASDGRPATEAQIVAWEKKIQAQLPSDYRGFLVQHNGGRAKVSAERAGDVAFQIRWNGQPWADEYAEAFLQGFYSLDNDSAFAWSTAEEEYLEQRRVPSDLLPIAYDRGSNQVLLGISGERRGKVYFWAKDLEPAEDTDEPGYENVGFIADSFGEFLAKLRPVK